MKILSHSEATPEGKSGKFQKKWKDMKIPLFCKVGHKNKKGHTNCTNQMKRNIKALENIVPFSSKTETRRKSTTCRIYTVKKWATQWIINNSHKGWGFTQTWRLCQKKNPDTPSEVEKPTGLNLIICNQRLKRTLSRCEVVKDDLTAW